MCKKTEIYMSKTIIEYDEFDTIISQNVYYDKEVKYHNNTNFTNVTNNSNTYTINSKTGEHVQSASPNTSPFSSVPTSPTLKPDAVIIDMSNVMNRN